MPISFLMVQVRVADALYSLIGLFGFPAFVGLVLGHLIANMFSPLGLIDLLSVLWFIPAKLAIWKWKFKAVPLHVVSVGLWVGWMLHSLFGLPLMMTIIYVATGEAIAEIIIGYPVYKTIKRIIKQVD